MTLQTYPETVVAAPTMPSRLADLSEALLYEATVIEELRQALLRQRAGVAGDDNEMVESSIHAMGRTLLTLDEAKRRRAALTALIAGGETTSLDRLESVLAGPLPSEVVEARTMVRRAALRTAQDVAINQHILRRALEAGDTFLQKLFSMGSEPAPAYQAGDRPAEAPARSGLLLNRTA